MPRQPCLFRAVHPREFLIKAASDDIRQRVIDTMSSTTSGKLGGSVQAGSDDRSFCNPERVDAQLAAHLTCGLAGFANRQSHFSKRRGDAAIDLLAACRRGDTTGGAIQKARANAAFELLNNLAQRRRG